MVDNGTDRRTNLFSSVDEKTAESQSIYKDRDIVTIGYIPEEDRIVGRDRQISELADEISPIVVGGKPNSPILYGKTGTGKSLVANFVAREARAEAAQRGYDVAIADIDCAECKKEATTIQKVAESINRGTSGIDVPTRGISASEYYSRLWNIVEAEYDGALIILDEVDQLVDDSVLMILSRARERGKVNVPIGIISISNKINMADQLSERTDSSMGHDGMLFEPYDGHQLREILRKRKDAFREGALEQDVIPKAAAIAAQTHGDARKAVRLLRNAGDYADRVGSETVKVGFLDEAKEQAKVERLRELISTLPPHSRYVLLAMANLDKNTEGEGSWFRSSEIHETYKTICDEHSSKPKSSNSVRKWLKELAFLEVTESQINHGGRGHGTAKEHRLLWDYSIVFQMGEDG